MGDNLDEHLGKRLFQRRRFMGLTQHQLGEAVGVRFQQIQKYECGANKISAARLWQISKVLQISVDYFFDGLGSTQKPSPEVRSVGGARGNRGVGVLMDVYGRLDEQGRRRLLDLARSWNGAEGPH
jgi:transcriptional regulator with XRE-family HTH domain